MTFLENRIPPPIIMLLNLILIGLIASVDKLIELPSMPRIVGAGVLVIAGVSMAIAGVSKFKLAETTINPLAPDSASHLVTGGIFQYTRNPMYLGMLLVILGATVYFSSIYSLAAVAAFYGYISRFQIIPEERAMANLFGDDFMKYKQQVRRWI